jgi:hypothetical protein
MNTSILRTTNTALSVYGIAAGVAGWVESNRPGLVIPKKPR